jgi:uncharacterized protein (DUF433 family)
VSAEEAMRAHDARRQRGASEAVRRVGERLGPGVGAELVSAFEEAMRLDPDLARNPWPGALFAGFLLWAGRQILLLRRSVASTPAQRQIGDPPTPEAVAQADALAAVLTAEAEAKRKEAWPPDATGCTCPKKWKVHEGPEGAARERVIAKLDPACPNHGANATRAVRLTVTKTPGVCGGVACLADTRMPVWILSRLDDGQVREFYPHLTEQQLLDARAYAAANPDEMAREIREHADIAPEDAAQVHRREHAQGDGIAAEREFRAVARDIAEAIESRYTACAMAIWNLFDADPLEDSASRTMLERLEAIVHKKLLAPTADLKVALRLGARALALVSKHEWSSYDAGRYCVECSVRRENFQPSVHKEGCEWGKLVAEAKALSRGG